MMSLIDTLNYFIQDQQGELQGYEWDIREETNQEEPDLDWYCEEYDLCKERIEDLQQIKSVIEQLEANK
jgi:spore coat polysaccharide biosynthesis protein SpsF (cytidylyltransferase family)